MNGHERLTLAPRLWERLPGRRNVFTSGGRQSVYQSKEVRMGSAAKAPDGGLGSAAGTKS